MDRLQEHVQKNTELFQDKIDGQEGIDYQVLSEKFEDPKIPSEKLLEKQLRRELSMLKV